MMPSLPQDDISWRQPLGTSVKVGIMITVCFSEIFWEQVWFNGSLEYLHQKMEVTKAPFVN